ncbi:MAG: hypothetical protein H8K04_11355 [Nitrospira sp.]
MDDCLRGSTAGGGLWTLLRLKGNQHFALGIDGPNIFDGRHSLDGHKDVGDSS